MVGAEHEAAYWAALKITLLEFFWKISLGTAVGVLLRSNSIWWKLADVSAIAQIRLEKNTT